MISTYLNVSPKGSHPPLTLSLNLTLTLALTLSLTLALAHIADACPRMEFIANTVGVSL